MVSAGCAVRLFCLFFVRPIEFYQLAHHRNIAIVQRFKNGVLIGGAILAIGACIFRGVTGVLSVLPSTWIPPEGKIGLAATVALFGVIALTGGMETINRGLVEGDISRETIVKAHEYRLKTKRT